MTATETIFWDKIADKYFAQPIADEDAYEEKLRVTQQYLRPDMTVFEFGCGTGGTALRHAPHVSEILATDISPRMIEIARQQATEKRMGHVTFEVANIETMPITENSYDVVMGMSILHLVHDRNAVIERVRSLLKPNGLFVSSTACLGDAMGWFKLVGPIGHALGLIPKVSVFKEKDLLTSLEAGGFDIDYVWRPTKSASVFLVARNKKEDT